MEEYMKSLKNHLSLIIPLFAILFAFEFYVVINKAIAEYEKNLQRDYSIIVVAKKELQRKELQGYYPNIQTVKEIDRDLIINRLQQKGVTLDFKELLTFLPKFYKVFLTRFPSQGEVKQIKEKLLRHPDITRVEIFLQIHEKMYKFLLFLQGISKIFLFLIFITSVLLIFKQIEVWHLEHRERMYIMALFGAPLWMRIAILFKLSLIDTFISALLVFVMYLYLLYTKFFEHLLGIEHLRLLPQELLQDLVVLILLGFLISFINILIVSMRQPKI